MQSQAPQDIAFRICWRYRVFTRTHSTAKKTSHLSSLTPKAKPPTSGRQSKPATTAYYLWQIQNQLVVSGTTQACLDVSDGKEGIFLKVSKFVDTEARIDAAWEAF